MQKPKEGEAQTKTVDGKKYHWCQKCEKWTIHAPNEHKEFKSEEAETDKAEATEAKIDGASILSMLQTVITERE